MEKTYFRQLLSLKDEVMTRGTVVQMLFADSLKRSLDFRDGFYDEGVCWEQQDYIRRNYEFIKDLLNVE